MIADPRERLRPWTWPIVMVGGLLLALRWGFNYGLGNQNTYLLQALRKVRPSGLVHDWLAATCEDYHPVFTQLAAVLIWLDSSGWLIALGNVASVVAGAVAVFLIIREVCGDRRAVPVYLLVISFVGIGSTYSVSGSYIFSTTFQPSTIAAVGHIVALLYFVRRRYFLSGIILAVAGAFHANYLVLAFPLFGLAHLFTGRRRLLVRWLAQLGPSLVPIAFLLPLLLGQTGSGNVEFARYIFQHVLNPQHYLPMNWLDQFVVYYAWCGLALVAGWRTLTGSEPARRLGRVWAASILLVSIATLLTTVVYLPVVSQLYIWRLAPLTVLMAQVFAAAGFGRYLFDGEPSISHRRRAGLFAVNAVLIWYVFRYHMGEYRDIHHGLMIALNVAFLIRPWLVHVLAGRSHVYAVVVVAGVWLTAAMAPTLDVTSRSNLITGMPSDEQALYDWVATTRESAVFLIPPGAGNFRYHSRRAVVVDAKSTPLNPDQLIEWYGRVQLVSGIDSVSNRNEIGAGYTRLDSARVVRIGVAYPFDYIVVRGNQAFAGMIGFEPVFQNGSYRVYRRTPSA